MSDPRLPIRIRSFTGGYVLALADGNRLWIYSRDLTIAKAARALTPEEAKALAKEVARALTKAWSEE